MLSHIAVIFSNLKEILIKVMESFLLNRVLNLIGFEFSQFYLPLIFISFKQRFLSLNHCGVFLLSLLFIYFYLVSSFNGLCLLLITSGVFYAFALHITAMSLIGPWNEHPDKE